MGDPFQLDPAIPPTERPLPSEKTPLRFAHRDVGWAVLSIRGGVVGGDGSASRTPRSNGELGIEPRIDVGFEEQRLALVTSLHGENFAAKLVLDVLRKSIGVGEFGGGEESVHGGPLEVHSRFRPTTFPWLASR